MNPRGTKLLLLFVAAAVYLAVSSAVTGSSAYDPPQRGKKRAKPAGSRPVTNARDYSNFTHQVAAHKMACDSCHKFPSANWKEVRKGDEAFPDVTDYPQHASCLTCHREQFFRGAPPSICSVCHVQPSPRNSTRYAFPNPRSIFEATKRCETAVSEYRVYFPHETHLE